MEWFRVYHGICSDQKWPIVARKAKVSVGTVVSVWLALLEFASQAAERGSVAAFDPETVDALYGYDDGTTAAVFGALTEKGLICDGRICAWQKRQPKRERDDDSAARVRQHRELKRRETTDNATVDDGNASVTPCNASVTPPEKIREEKKREEKNLNTPPHPPLVGGERSAGSSSASQAAFSPSGSREADAAPRTQKPSRRTLKAQHDAGNSIADLRAVMEAYTVNTDLRQALEDFRVMRERLRKPLTARALHLTCTELDKLAGKDEALKVKILDQSVQRGWQGVFTLKPDAAGQQEDRWAGAI